MESSCGVTTLHIMLHLLPLISGGVKSEKSWEWPDLEDSTDRLNSGNGKTKSNYAHPRDSASRDNWVTATQLLSTVYRTHHEETIRCALNVKTFLHT